MVDLVYLHTNNTDSIQDFLSTLRSDQYLHFKTCLRSIYFFNFSKLDEKQNLHLKKIGETHEILFQGESALTFLTEILCGLRSRVLGETEIFGQFKFFFESTPMELRSHFINAQTMHQIFQIVKDIRENHITHWGVHSYGALVRKYCKTYASVDVLGYGHLAQEILPWIEKKQLTLHVRDAAKVSADDHQRLTVKSLAQFFDSEVLVIAAPMKAEDLVKLIGETKLIIDGRALDAQTTSIRTMTDIPVVELNDMFAIIEHDQAQLYEKAQDVKERIQIKTIDLYHKNTHRPLGWDDLCL